MTTWKSKTQIMAIYLKSIKVYFFKLISIILSAQPTILLFHFLFKLQKPNGFQLFLCQGDAHSIKSVKTLLSIVL